jgi:hypothetical protein
MGLTGYQEIFTRACTHTVLGIHHYGKGQEELTFAARNAFAIAMASLYTPEPFMFIVVSVESQGKCRYNEK